MTMIDTPERLAGFELGGGLILNPIAPIVIDRSQMTTDPSQPAIATMTHPSYALESSEWEKWREVWDGGDAFIEKHVKQFSTREDSEDFKRRKSITPIPGFAKAAVNEVKNAILARMTDVIRSGGPPSYQSSIKGEYGGVDLKSSTINSFIADRVLPELLFMKRVGVYVDNFQLESNVSIQGKGNRHPYFYTYRIEDIRSWVKSSNSSIQTYQAVLLRDYSYILDPETKLPIGEREQFRFLWIADDGFVHVRFYDCSSSRIDIEGSLDSAAEYTLKIRAIPFHTFELSASLIKDVANHQIALANLESSDLSFLLKANVPFYVEQYDPSNNVGYLKTAKAAYTKQFAKTDLQGNPVTEPGQPGYITDANGITTATIGEPPPPPGDNEIDTGTAEGRRYPVNMDAPAFIAPDTTSIDASIKKQESLKADIDKLVNSAVSNTKASSAPAEARSMDQEGYAAGLAAIAFELQQGEICIGWIWSLYEESDKYPTVIYPDKYFSQTPDSIKKQIDQKLELRAEIPSSTFRKELNKEIVRTAMGARLPTDILATIMTEIDASTFYTGNAKDIQSDVQEGLVGTETASKLRGYPKGEADQARKDSAEKARLVLAAQSPAPSSASNPAARGLPELAINPSQEAAQEKAGQPGRGPAAN